MAEAERGILHPGCHVELMREVCLPHVLTRTTAVVNLSKLEVLRAARPNRGPCGASACAFRFRRGAPAPAGWASSGRRAAVTASQLTPPCTARRTMDTAGHHGSTYHAMHEHVGPGVSARGVADGSCV